MELILLVPVRKLGKIGDIVNVKNGYAKNFLLPNRKALRLTKENMAVFEAQKAELQTRSQSAKEEASKLVSAIEGKIVTVVKQASVDGKLFGSVSSKDIAKLLSDSGVVVLQEHIVLAEPLKNIGIFKIEISPYVEVSCEVLVNISRSSDEAVAALKAYESNKNSPSSEVESDEIEA